MRADQPLAFSLPWLSCERCGLCKDRNYVVLGVGNPNADVMFVGEGPGPDEDRIGYPFIGKSGKLLTEFLEDRLHWRREEVFIDNIVACFVGGTRVESVGVHTRYRRKYSGDLVRVITETDELTGTPNHPVLTTSGWKPLRDLSEGDHIVRCGLTEVMRCGDPDVKDGPTQIQEVAGPTAEYSTRHRIVVGDVDFHGDGNNSEVEIVTVNRLLTNILYTSSVKKISQSILKSPGHLFRFLKLLRPCPRSLAVLLRRHSSSTSLLASRSSPLDSFLYRNDIVPANESFGTISNVNTTIQKIPPKSWWTDVGRPRYGFESFPGEVSFEKVIKVNISSFDGHVFNLGTHQGWYTANGYVVSNCFPHNNEEGTATIRKPSSKEIAACRDRVMETVYRVDPLLIVALGATALYGLTGVNESLKSTRGEMFFAKVPGFYKYVSYPVISTYHPAALLRNPTVRPGSFVSDFWEDLKFARTIVDQLKRLYEEGGEQ